MNSNESTFASSRLKLFSVYFFNSCIVMSVIMNILTVAVASTYILSWSHNEYQPRSLMNTDYFTKSALTTAEFNQLVQEIASIVINETLAAPDSSVQELNSNINALQDQTDAMQVQLETITSAANTVAAYSSNWAATQSQINQLISSTESSVQSLTSSVSSANQDVSRLLSSLSTSYTTGNALNNGASGHAIFPGGFMIQWGSTSAYTDNFDDWYWHQATVYFSTSFPNTCLSVVTTANPNNSGMQLSAVSSWNAQSFSIELDATQRDNMQAFYIAVGY